MQVHRLIAKEAQFVHPRTSIKLFRFFGESLTRSDAIFRDSIPYLLPLNYRHSKLSSISVTSLLREKYPTATTIYRLLGNLQPGDNLSLNTFLKVRRPDTANSR